MDFPKKQQQSLIPRYLLQYLQDLQISHNDPTAPWGGGGGGSYTSGDGINISSDNVISVDNTVAKKSDLPTNYVTTDTYQVITGQKQINTGFYFGDGDHNSIGINANYINRPLIAMYNDTTGVEFSIGVDNGTETPVNGAYFSHTDDNGERYYTLPYQSATGLSTYTLATTDDIPTKTSNLTNDSGFITSSALTGYATESWVTNQGYSTFSGSYNDLTNKPTIPAALSGGTWINIDSNNNINVYNPYISLLDGSSNPRIMISSTSNGTSPTFTATYCNITPTGFGIVDKTQGLFGGYNAAYTYYRHRNILVNNKWTLSFPTDDGTIATREWVTNQGYSTSSGTYSGNYWTSITINGTTKSIPSGGSAPTNMVTTDTAQEITATKTFVGAKKIGFRQANTSDVVGFTIYNTSQNEIGNLQVANRTAGGNTYTYVTLGNYSSAYTSKAKLGFRVQPNGSSNSFNFVMPYGTYSNFTANGYSTTADTTIPCAFTDGTTIVKADATGLVNISSISGGGGGGTTVSGTNDGTNWTSITIGSDTYGIPSGGSGSSMSNYRIEFTGTDSGTNIDMVIKCTLKDNATLVPGTYTTFDEDTDLPLINYLNNVLSDSFGINYAGGGGIDAFYSFNLSGTTLNYLGFTISELIIEKLAY